MRVVVQRVSRASVSIDGEVVGRIDRGLLVLVGVRKGDDDRQVRFLADKLLNLRIFADEAGKMNRSVLDTRGGLLVVSQFTLYGDCRKGRRPSFLGAADPEFAIPVYERFVTRLRDSELTVSTGRFGAMMAVDSVNDGPVTLIIDAPED